MFIDIMGDFLASKRSFQNLVTLTAAGLVALISLLVVRFLVTVPSAFFCLSQILI